MTGTELAEITPVELLARQPKVSVAMITYNHEPFIGEAVEGVLRQETTFPIELIIGEDCSTDQTRRIALDYQRRHPDKVRLVLWKKNAGMGKNSEQTTNLCRGEYIAYCEGDDYWTDPTKLQRQVELMDSNPGFSLCHHVVNYVQWNKGNRTILNEFPEQEFRRPAKAEDLIGRNFIQTCSIVARRSMRPVFDDEFRTLKLGDWPICFLMAEKGPIGFVDRNMADYRIHGSNTWCNLPQQTRGVETARMFFYLAKVARPEFQPAWRRHAFQLLKDSITFAPDCRQTWAMIWRLTRGQPSRLSMTSQLCWHQLRHCPLPKLRRNPRLHALVRTLLRENKN